MAKGFCDAGIPLELIARQTGLSEEEIQNLYFPFQTKVLLRAGLDGIQRVCDALLEKNQKWERALCSSCRILSVSVFAVFAIARSPLPELCPCPDCKSLHKILRIAVLLNFASISQLNFANQNANFQSMKKPLRREAKNNDRF